MGSVLMVRLGGYSCSEKERKTHSATHYSISGVLSDKPGGLPVWQLSCNLNILAFSCLWDL